MAHTLTLWTNDPLRATWGDRAGVDRIGLDLETLGKEERQRDLPTWISKHSFEDLARIKPALSNATLFVRTNPLNQRSALEVDQLLVGGVGVIMLPNFTRADEVETFLGIVAGRACVLPLVERIAAIEVIPALADFGIDEIHVGLNDLAIDAGQRNTLAMLGSPLMDRIAAAARGAGLRLGVGGLGRAMDVDLPVPSDLVYAQHPRLGSTGALIARSFFKSEMKETEFIEEIARLRSRIAEWALASPDELEAARAALMRYAES